METLTSSAGLVFSSVQIIGTRSVVYSVWSHKAGETASSITHDATGRRLGRIGTDPFRDCYTGLRGAARADAVRAEFASRAHVAYAALEARFPHLVGKGSRSGGEIETVEV